MRNTKKLIAVIMTIAILASMMVPALAASNTTQFEALKAAGLMLGTGEAVETDLAKPLNRIQGFVLVVRAMGVEATAAAMTEAEMNAALATVEDADMIPAWGRPHAAYAVANGLTNGVGGAAAGMIKFAPTSPLTGLQFITMMLRAMNYTGVTLANCVDKAIESGMLTASQAVAVATKASFLRDDAALVLFSTVKGGMMASATGVTPGSMKLIDKLVEAGAVTSTAAVAFGYVAPTPAPAPLLTVSAVSATNLKEINVKFSEVPDKTTAEDVANYVLSAKGPATKAVLNGDTVTLTLTGDAVQQESIEITFKNIKSSAGVAIVEGKKTVTMFDVTLPTFVSYVFTGPQTLELTYSEPIKAPGTALIDNGVYGASAAVSLTKNNVVVLTLGTTMTEGAHTLKMTNVTDFADFKAIEHVISLNFVLDKTAPTASLTKATQTSVTISFSKDVKGIVSGASGTFYHTYSAYFPTAVEDTAVPPAAVTQGNFYKEVVLDFSDRPLPAGASTVAVMKAVGDVKITDRWGNVMAADAFLTATTVADVTAPTITKIEATNETTVEITYSEDMDADSVKNKANYVFKKADGTVVAPAADLIVYADKKATVKFAAMVGGTYTVTVSGVKDDSLNKNVIATVTQSFIVSDKTPPTVSGNAEITGTTTKTVYLTFNEAVASSGAGSAVDVNNYLSDTNKKPSAAVMFGSAGKTVKLTFADGDITVGAGKLIIGQIADLAGNRIVALATPVTVVSLAAIDGTSVTSIKTKSLNTIEIVINKVIPTLSTSAFLITEGAGGNDIAAPAMISYSNDGTKTTVIATLTAETANSSPSDKPDNVRFVADGLVSDLGATNAQFDVTTIVDGIAPSYVSVAQVSSSRFDVTFDEAIDANVNNTLIATDFVVKKADGTVLVPGVGYITSANGTKIEFTLSVALTADETLTIATVAAPLYVKDSDGGAGTGLNVMNAFTAKNVVMDATAPLVADIAKLTITDTTVAGIAAAVEGGATVKIVANGAAVTDAHAGSGVVVAATNGSFAAISGLTAATPYDLYVIDTVGNVSVKLDITTAAAP